VTELPGRISTPPAIDDPSFRPNPRSAAAGAAIYNRRCIGCHGASAVSATHAPDLRRSSVLLSRPAFASVVRDGAMVGEGMPRFGELSDKDRDDLRQYLRGEAKARPSLANKDGSTQTAR
jgi:quinohemoprotein ethanol dehydrogenase